jgi:hypothetical protein
MGEALLARGALSPLIHGTWAAIVDGVLWCERRGGRLRVSMLVLGVFFGVVALHGLWEWTIGAVPIEIPLPALRLPS